MYDHGISKSIKIIVPITYLAMIIVNALANALPINGQGTGQISDAYPNLFAPAGYTFAIWGLIYLLLGGYTFYQLGFFRGEQRLVKASLLNKVGFYFSVSSVANGAWIFSWHYHQIPLSMLLMIVILGCLIVINRSIAPERLTGREKLFIRLPFSVYFGWITVATIANATVLLVSLGWDGFGLSEATWTVIMLSVGMLIGVATLLKNRDIAYGIVLVWAYGGIWQKHTSAAGFGGQYGSVIVTVLACIALFAAAGSYVLIVQKKRQTL